MSEFTSDELRELGLPTYADLRKECDEWLTHANNLGDALAKCEVELEATIERAREWVAGDLDLNEMTRDEAIASFDASLSSDPVVGAAYLAILVLSTSMKGQTWQDS